MAKYVHFLPPLSSIPETPEDTRRWSVEEEFDARMLLTHPHQFSDAEDDSSDSESEDIDQSLPRQP
jgi:hypothetical protein